MPALDRCHYPVVNALRKDGWQIHPKPRYLSESRSDLNGNRPTRLLFIFVDIDAYQPANRSILVEVKCLSPGSPPRDLYTAIGQYVLYRAIMLNQNITSRLYLAVPEQAYNALFNTVLYHALETLDVKFILFDIETETIVKWIR